jgi:hypothetical protein
MTLRQRLVHCSEQAPRVTVCTVGHAQRTRHVMTFAANTLRQDICCNVT